DENFLRCLKQLFVSYVEGYHLLYILPTVTEVIYSKYYKLMDPDTQAHFLTYMEETAFEIDGMFKFVNYAIQLIPSNMKTHNSYNPPYKTYESLEIGYLPICDFLTSRNIQPTKIIGEDLNDIKVFEIMARYFLKTKDINLKVEFEAQPGGGGNTAKILKSEILNSHKLCLCITDSDRRSPSNPKMQSTATNAHTVFINNKTPKVGFFIEKKVREMENYLPRLFYENWVCQHNDKSYIFEHIESLNSSNDELIFFVSMKDGLTFEQASKEADWKNWLQSISKQMCDKCKCDNCKCKVLDGYGSSLLERFVIYENEVNIGIEAFQSSPTGLVSLWEKIGQLLFSWGCAQGDIPQNS
ncbi:hypothetical protein MJH12_03795, partial [bacterium]|nr:hypothetical protein [bacterium]